MTDPSAEREALIAELIDAQSRMQDAMLPLVTAQLLTFPLTIQQLKVLAILATDPKGSTIAGVAGIVEVSLATMSGIIDRLQQRGMVTRVEDPRDQRVRRVLATDAGRATLQRLIATQPQLNALMLNSLQTEELQALTLGVGALLRVMTQQNPDASD